MKHAPSGFASPTEATDACELGRLWTAGASANLGTFIISTYDKKKILQTL